MDSTSVVVNEEEGVEGATPATEVISGDEKQPGSSAWDWFVKFCSYGGFLLIIVLFGAIAIAILQLLGK